MPVNNTVKPLPPIPSTGKQDDPGQYIRCPIPPIGLGPTDNLRQFYNGGRVPQYRAQMTRSALPGGGNSGGSSTITTVVAETPSVPSGGGGVSTNGIFTASINTPVLNQNQTYSGTIVLAKTYIILKVGVTAAARVRVYVTQSFATNDIGRSAATPVSLGLQNGIVGDWLLQASSEFSWLCSPAPVGYNGDEPTTSTAYITVTNPNASSNSIQVSLTYATLES